MSSDLIEGWTKDAAGNYVDWTKPPYKRGGVINLLLAGETDISQHNFDKRLIEYLRLTRRALKGRKDNAPVRENDRGVGNQQKLVF